MTLLPFEYGVRNLGRSPARLVAIVLGSALVVSLFVAASAFVRGMERSLVMAATVIIIAPLLLAFLFFQRQFINSFLYSGVK